MVTSIISCVIRKGHFRPLNPERVKAWKDAHTEGEVFQMILDDGTSSALTPMARKYFATRDDYATLNGYTKPYAHTELKHLYGVTFPQDEPPENRLVRLVEAYGEFEWQLSVKEYNKEELMALVSGSDLALLEASV